MYIVMPVPAVCRLLSGRVTGADRARPRQRPGLPPVGGGANIVERLWSCRYAGAGRSRGWPGQCAESARQGTEVTLVVPITLQPADAVANEARAVPTYKPKERARREPD